DFSAQIVDRDSGECLDVSGNDGFERHRGRNLQIFLCIRRDERDKDLEQQLKVFGFRREDDVLDTWFSSALWPHSTLGWPDQTPELAKFYPTSVLSTSRDILTLWVARMVLMGLYNMGEVPFHEVYIHTKILDGYG